MAESLRSTYDFVKSAIPVHVGTLSSDDAQNICQKNNLSFAELIEPFCTLTNEIQVQGNGSQVYRICNLHIQVADIREQSFSIAEPAAQQLMSNLIAGSSSTENKQIIALPRYQSLAINRSCPWMEIYRDLVFRFSPPQEHEFLCHNVACMLVVSSDNPNPLQEFANLSQLQNRIQHGGKEEAKRHWMTPNTLKYYVLLHDVQSGNITKAREVFSSLQSMYGQSMCVLLQINSKATSAANVGQDLPVPWHHFRNYSVGKKLGRTSMELKNKQDGYHNHALNEDNVADHEFGCCLTMSDHNALQGFVQQFIKFALLPYLEKVVKSINEQISGRKTLHKSLFRATRTLFGSGKSSLGSATGYHHDANELLLRKAADLCFLSQMYDQAFNLYHAAKKEYTNDQVWLYAAGASEMAALSNFMQRNSQKSYPSHYMESAISSYIDVCKNDYLALRCTLVHVECLQHLKLFQDAAFHLVKLTNETDDLRSALLLEQAAHCYLKMKEPHPKKFAFQLILAGHRYGKCGQRIHALRCYDIALQIFSGRNWQLAEDHLNLAVARQSYNTKQIDRATDFFHKLLVNESSQAEKQQASILREFISIFEQRDDSEGTGNNCSLGLPEILMEETEVVVGCSKAVEGISIKSAPHRNIKIMCLESSLMEEESLVRNQVVGATTLLCKYTSNAECPRLGVGETSGFIFHCKNYLNTPICLSNIELKCDFEPWENGVPTRDDLYHCDAPPQLSIPACGKQKAHFSFTPHKAGNFVVSGISYRLGQLASDGKLDCGASILIYQPLQIIGKRLNRTKDEKTARLYDVDNRLRFHVHENLPKISVSFQNFPSSMICNEHVSMKMFVQNIGNVPVDVLKVVGCDPVKFTLLDCKGLELCLPNFTQLESQGMVKTGTTVSLLQKPLAPDEITELEAKLKAPAEPGLYEADMLCFFRSSGLSPPCCRTQFQEHDLDCVEVIQVVANMVTPLSQSSIVIALSVKNLSETAVSQLQFEGLRCLDGDGTITAIDEQVSTLLPAGANLLTYFLVEKADMARVSDGLCCNQPMGATEEDIDDLLKIAVSWRCKIGPKRICGEHHVRTTRSFSNFGLFSHSQIPTRSLDEVNGLSLQRMHHLVSWKLVYNPHHCHDFSSCRLCHVGLNLVIFNLSDQELLVQVTLPQCGSVTELQSQNGFSWVGAVETRYIIKPRDEVNTPLKAAFARPGTFNLCGVNVTALPTALTDAEMPIPQKPLCGYYLSVTDC